MNKKRGAKMRGADAALVKTSELFGTPAVQRTTASANGLLQAQDAWQQAVDVEVGGGDFRAIKTFVFTAFLQGDLSLRAQSQA